MAKKEEEIQLTADEKKIVELFLIEKYSIRRICSIMKGYGRTKVKNILQKYASTSEEAAMQIQLRMRNSKNHKEDESLDDTNMENLSEEQAKEAYKSIVYDGETLTSVAERYGKNRETVKKAVLDYLDDEEDEKNFIETLQKNRHKSGNEKKSFLSLSEDKKKEEIFEKLHYITKKQGREDYNIVFLDNNFKRIFEYFYKERNEKIQDESSKLSKDDIYLMMYEFPKIVTMSLSNKIKPVVNALDYEHLDYEKTSTVLKENPSVVGTALTRLKLQMRILKDTDTLKYVLKKPRILRTSPELMYALIKRNESENPEKSKDINPFMSRAKLLERCYVTPEQIKEIYNIKSEYSDDEYFDGR